MGPDAAVVVRERVVGAHPRRQGANAEAGEAIGLEQTSCDHLGVVGGEDARPQQVPRIRRDRVDGPLLTIEGLGEEAALGKEEAIAHGLRQFLGDGAQLIAVSLSEVVAEVGGGEVGGVGIPLHLAQRDGPFGEASVGEGDGVPAVLPSLVPQERRRVGGVLDEAVAVGVTPPSHPLHGVLHRRHQPLQLGAFGAEAEELTGQHDEERCRVDGAVVHVRAAQRGVGPLPQAHLVEDLAGRLGGHRVVGDALVTGQDLHGRERAADIEEQRLPRRDDGVAAEQGHEPRDAGGEDGVVGVLRVADAEDAEVVDGAVAEAVPRVHRAVEVGLASAPAVEVEWVFPPRRVQDAPPGDDHAVADHRDELDVDRPLGVWLQLDPEVPLALRQLGVGVEAHLQAAPEVLALVPEVQASVAGARPEEPVLAHARLLHLEQVGEIGVEEEVETARGRLRADVAQQYAFAHPCPHLADALHEQAGRLLPARHHRQEGACARRPRLKGKVGSGLTVEE